MGILTDTKARNLQPGSKPVQHGGVPGLRLEPGRTKGSGKWILRFVSPETGTRRDMGLGSYPDLGIAKAEDAARDARKLLAEGIDPINAKRARKAEEQSAAAALTFKRAAEDFHEANKPAWKNAKHQAQWINTLREYVMPAIGVRKVAELQPKDFADALRPIWLDKPETASRVKQRCHTVMKWCWAQGLVQSNPLDVVDHLLPKLPGKRERVQHQPAMPWRVIPQFVGGTLRNGPSNVTRALLEFVILTAVRSGEARAMRWGEIDDETKVWTVPADRMKAKVEHRVPLSTGALRILDSLRPEEVKPDQLVFPAPRGGVLSDMALTKFLRDQKAASDANGRFATAHGFRSSFRDWASESGFARDLAEKALAHTIANQVEAAYHRTDLLEQRRPMMEAWASHVCGDKTVSNVVHMGRRA